MIPKQHLGTILVTSKLVNSDSDQLTAAVAKFNNYVEKEMALTEAARSLQTSQSCPNVTEPSAEILFDSIVAVYVGTNKAKFDVHKGLLCHYSSYFKAALGGNFKESKEGFVSLEDETEQTFKLFYLWLYSQKMVGEVGREHKGWLELAELFVFADKRGAPKLKNRIIDEIVARNIQLRIVPVTVVPYVYANTLESSPLRKLLVDLVAWDIDVQSSNVFDTPQSYTKDYLFDLVRAVDERPSPRNPTNAPYHKNICSYHEHDEEAGKTK